ncbi:MAG: amidohydrolase family protein [Candidatus Binatia bacterium]
MIIDFERHYVPEELARKRGLYSETTSFTKDGTMPRLTMHSKLYDAEGQLRDMDEAGIDTSVLSCLLGWDAPLQDCQFINDKFAELQQRFPGRFVGLAQAPVLEGGEAMKELDRAIRDLGLYGVTITSQVKGLSLDSPKLYEFYAKVSELDVPIFVHPAMLPKGYEFLTDLDLPRILGREVDLSVATTRIIAGGILDRFPTLKFVIGHFGGGISAVKDRLVAKGYRFGTLMRPFEEYFDMLYFDLAGFEGGLTALRCALLGIKPERLVFASDYPQDFTGVSTDTGKGMESLREYIAAVRRLEIKEELKDGILGGTASWLLKLHNNQS